MIEDFQLRPPWNIREGHPLADPDRLARFERLSKAHRKFKRAYNAFDRGTGELPRDLRDAVWTIEGLLDHIERELVRCLGLARKPRVSNAFAGQAGKVECHRYRVNLYCAE